jgi:hypothetical protein
MKENVGLIAASLGFGTAVAGVALVSSVATPAFLAVIFGTVGGAFGGFFKDRATMRLQHRFEERRKLRDLQSRYKGRMLEAALDWDRRMMQLYEGAYAWLDPDDDKRKDVDEYYFQSVVFRFLQLTAIARRFEAEAYYLDPSVARGKDFDLLRYAKAMLWVMIHAEISPNDGQPGEDHFRSDAFRPLLDYCYSTPSSDENGKPRVAGALPETRSRDNELIFDLERYLAMLRCADEGHVGNVYVDELLELFDGVRPDDYAADGRQRRRWDRLVALHLVTLAFIDACGYEWHHRDVKQRMRLAADMLLYPDVLAREFEIWLPRLGLAEQKEMTHVRHALPAVSADAAARTPEARAARVHAAIAGNNKTRGIRNAPPALQHSPKPDDTAAADGGR